MDRKKYRRTWQSTRVARQKANTLARDADVIRKNPIICLSPPGTCSSRNFRAGTVEASAHSQLAAGVLVVVMMQMQLGYQCANIGLHQICNFNASFCDWTQDVDDSSDWTLGSASTPTSNTGPCAGSGHGGGAFAHIEAKPGVE
jgi:hypothetical protein